MAALDVSAARPSPKGALAHPAPRQSVSRGGLGLSSPMSVLRVYIVGAHHCVAGICNPILDTYLQAMLKSKYLPCIPTRGAKVPDRAEWIHEVKHDGYRLIVQREGQRARLFTRNGQLERALSAHYRGRTAQRLSSMARPCCLASTAGRISTPCIPASTIMRSSSTPSICWSATARICAGCR